MKPLVPALRRVQTPQEIYRARFIIALTVTLASVLELVDTSIVNVAIPHMMGSLGATLDEITWVSTGYVVANVIVLPISAWLANWFGRRNYFALSILLFVFASFLCGNASSLESLVFWRIVQGLGGGGLISTAQATLYESFPPEEAGTGMAIFGLGIMTGPMLGPTLGGYITDAASWPWIFYVNIPLGAIALLLALMYVPEQRFGSRAEEVDFAGLLLLALGVGCLQTLLERGEKLDWWNSREIIAYAITSASALSLFVWHELRHPHPIVELRILKDLQFSVSLIYAFILGAALFSVVFVFPVYVQTLIGFTAWDTGIAVLPGAIASGITMAMMGKFMPRLGIDLRLLVLGGATIFAYSMWQHSLFTVESGAVDFFWPMVVRGIGLGMVFIPLNNLALGNLAPNKLAQASGIYNLLRQLGGSVGIALSATLYSQFQERNRGELLRHASTFNDATVERLARLEHVMRSHGFSVQDAHGKALTLFDSLLRKQAAMLAFERLFLYFGLMMLAALPLLLLMRNNRFTARGIAVDH